MIDTLQNLTTVQQIIALLAIAAGLWQAVLCLAMIVHGGHITLWPGIIFVVLTGVLLVVV